MSRHRKAAPRSVRFGLAGTAVGSGIAGVMLLASACSGGTAQVAGHGDPNPDGLAVQACSTMWQLDDTGQIVSASRWDAPLSEQSLQDEAIGAAHAAELADYASQLDHDYDALDTATGEVAIYLKTVADGYPGVESDPSALLAGQAPITRMQSLCGGLFRR